MLDLEEEELSRSILSNFRKYMFSSQLLDELIVMSLFVHLLLL